MKRELKATLYISYVDFIRPVTRHIPMKRELKVKIPDRINLNNLSESQGISR